ncbi:MAG: hypothetical protein K1X29_05525 [Bdellovibrionales bacterium]|nr:hypothetical protein [Bdellovibrionales bacterium]
MESIENSTKLSTSPQTGPEIPLPKNEDYEQRVLKVRCPQCFKLYSVMAAEIKESKPQFECIKCYSKFWFPFPELDAQKEVLGFPVAWLSGQSESDGKSGPISVEAKEATSATKSNLVEKKQSANLNLEHKSIGRSDPLLGTKFHCPRCQALYHSGDKECPKCGVVFAKLNFLENHQSWVPASSHLRQQWQAVLGKYEDLDSHRRFVGLCHKENNLVYASQQYRRLLEAHSGDEIALQMQKEIEALNLAVSSLLKPRTQWAKKIFPRLSTLVMICGGILIGIGFMVPAARNLIGLGVAIIFFVVTLEWFFQKSA